MTLFQMMEYMTNNGISYCFNSYARGTGDYFFYNMKVKAGIEHYFHDHTVKEIEDKMNEIWKDIVKENKDASKKKSVPKPSPLPAPKGIPLPPGM